MNGYNYNPWDLEILDFKFAIQSKETWLTFNVTHAVQWWMENKINLQMLQVRIDPVHPFEVKFGSIDISLDRSNGEGTEPQLVIYSSTTEFDTVNFYRYCKKLDSNDAILKLSES